MSAAGSDPGVKGQRYLTWESISVNLLRRDKKFCIRGRFPEITIGDAN